MVVTISFDETVRFAGAVVVAAVVVLDLHVDCVKSIKLLIASSVNTIVSSSARLSKVNYLVVGAGCGGSCCCCGL